jgi:hypothetical protein
MTWSACTSLFMLLAISSQARQSFLTTLSNYKHIRIGT